MSSVDFSVVGAVLLGVILATVCILPSVQRRRLARRLKAAEAHVVATGQQRPGLHLTAIAAEVISSLLLARDHAFKAEALLRLALANAKLQNLSETARLSTAAAQAYQQIQPRRGVAYKRAVRDLALLHAAIGRELNRQGHAKFAYEKLKLAFDLLPQLPTTDKEEAEIKREASAIFRALLQKAQCAETEDRRFRAALQLIDVLPFNIVALTVRPFLRRFRRNGTKPCIEV